MSCSLKKNLSPTIAIMTPQALNKLSAQRINFYSSLLKNIVFIVIAKSQKVPDFLKAMAAANRIPIATSGFDEYYLTSSIKGMIREKVHKKTSIHGVLIESGGMGMLIVGASGIGKTTAALKYVQKEGYWIADDLAVIRRNNHGELIARGHAKIKKYLDYGKEGIIPVEKILATKKIKNETKIKAIINVEKILINGSVFSETKKKILDTDLPCLNINISDSGYFNEKLLEKTIKKLKKAYH